MPILNYILAALAAMAAGLTNALAGGGTLITFPVLLAIGLPAVSANVTNTVALCPGFLGGTLAQAKDLQGQKKRLWTIIPAGILGGFVGGYLLLITSEKIFTNLVPFLILVASALSPTARPSGHVATPMVFAASRPPPTAPSWSRAASTEATARIAPP